MKRSPCISIELDSSLIYPKPVILLQNTDMLRSFVRICSRECLELSLRVDATLAFDLRLRERELLSFFARLACYSPFPFSPFSRSPATMKITTFLALALTSSSAYAVNVVGYTSANCEGAPLYISNYDAGAGCVRTVL